MSAIQPAAAPERPLFMRPAPGYFTTRRVLKRLRKFQNIIRHKERWATDIRFACPIEEVLPPNTPVSEQVEVLEKEIHRMMHIVRWDINYAGVTTAVVHKHWDPAERKNQENRYDLILDYFRLPREPNSYQAYEAVMAALEQAIGMYEARLRQAKRDVFNPVVWAAHLIRLPITIMERAGLVGHEKTAHMVLGGYAKFMKVVMALIVVFVALRVGVKLPWNEMFVKVLELITK
jgi:hypothetical protein